MATARHHQPDFSKWPKINEWNIDDSLDYGVYERHSDNRGIKYHTSYGTLLDLVKYEDMFDSEGNAISAVPAEPKKVREDVLDEASTLITGDREKQYGTPYDHFLEVSKVLNSFGFSGPGGREIKPEDVSFFQLVVKLSRILKTPDKRDSWVDIAGYAALGYEVAIHE